MSMVIFLLVTLLGAFVQTVTGFALGLLIIALAAGLELVSIPVLTATASLLSLANVGLALRTRYRDINARFWVWVTLGQIPAIGLGLLVMMALNDNAGLLLQLLLGVFVLLGSVSMVRADSVLERESTVPVRFFAGLAGGLCGGMFSASGPVMGWFFYRQPMAMDAIRATLLACFGVTTSVRTLIVGVRGELSSEILWLTAASLPMIVLGTWLGGRYAARIPAQALRRGAFGLLTLMGAVIAGRALWQLAG